MTGNFSAQPTWAQATSVAISAARGLTQVEDLLDALRRTEEASAWGDCPVDAASPLVSLLAAWRADATERADGENLVRIQFASDALSDVIAAIDDPAWRKA